MQRLWRWIRHDDSAYPGVYNMAVDQVLQESVRGGAPPVLRFYRWDPPCLSLGRNQRTAGVLTPESVAAMGLDVVRRPTGGAAVVHDRELTYSVAVPVGELGSPRETYLALNRALVAGLQRLGIAASTAPLARSGGPAPGDPRMEAACFRNAAPGEVLACGRKLVGSAQRCQDRVVLQHGSILLDEPTYDVEDLWQTDGAAGTSPAALSVTTGMAGAATVARPRTAATIASVLGYVPPWPAIVAALAAGFEEALGVRLEPSSLSPDEARRAIGLTRTIGSPEWTWRR